MNLAYTPKKLQLFWLDNNKYIHSNSKPICPSALTFSTLLGQDSDYNTKPAILVIDCQKKIVSLNKKLISLWNFPKHIIDSRSGELALEYIDKQLFEPENFKSEIKFLDRFDDSVSHSKLELKNGKVFEFSSEPQFLEKNLVGRIWNFRQIRGSYLNN